MPAAIVLYFDARFMLSLYLIAVGEVISAFGRANAGEGVCLHQADSLAGPRGLPLGSEHQPAFRSTFISAVATRMIISSTSLVSE
jgi:hypothetical protein